MQRYADKPFALLGVNTDTNKDDYRRQAQEHRVTWRSAWQGSTSGPITAQWGVRGYPTIHVIDAEGRLRATSVRGEQVDRAVEQLLAEMERKEKEKEAPPAADGGEIPPPPQAGTGEQEDRDQAAESPASAALPAEEQAAAVPAAAPAGFEDLVREYDGALRAWQQDPLRVDAGHPLAEYEATFEALAREGDGRAALWLLKYLGQRPTGDATPRRLELLEELVKQHANAEWLDGIEVAVADLWFRGEEQARLLKAAHALLHATQNETVEKKLAFRLGWALATQPRDSADEEAATELFEYVARTWPDDEFAERSRGRLFRQRHLRQGMSVPELVGQTVDGEEVRLSSYRGKVLVIDFWGFWCGPCRAELPHLKALVERHPAAELAVLGIDTDTDPADFRAKCAEFGVTWTNVFQGSTAGPLTRGWGIDSYPTIFVVDPTGKIRGDDARGAELERLVDELIAEARASRGD